MVIRLSCLDVVTGLEGKILKYIHPKDGLMAITGMTEMTCFKVATSPGERKLWIQIQPEEGLMAIAGTTELSCLDVVTSLE